MNLSEDQLEILRWCAGWMKGNVFILTNDLEPLQEAGLVAIIKTYGRFSSYLTTPAGIWMLPEGVGVKQ